MTTDHKTIEAARAAFEDILEEAPLAPSWHAASGQVQVQRLHRVENERRPLFVLVGAAALVLAVVGSIGVASLILRSGPEPVGNDTAVTTVTPVRDVATPTTVVTESTPRTTVASPEVVLGTDLGPEPQFDTSVLGEEVAPDRSRDPSGLLRDDELALIFGSDTGQTGDPLYVGESGGVHGFVIPAIVSPGLDTGLCFVTKYDDSRTGRAAAGWACFGAVRGSGGDPHIQSFYSVSGDRPDDDAILFAHPLEGLFLVDDPTVSVIAIETSPGDAQWQRPIGGAALFVIDTAGGVGPFTITAYDASGETIATERFTPPTDSDTG